MHLFDNSNVTNKFSKSELTVYQYINEHKEMINEISAEQLAQITFTSPATINRMAKKLGTEGFSHLKHALIDDLKLQSNHQESQKTLRDTTQLLTKINFDESVKLATEIANGKMLFIYSAGATRIAALYLERQLLNIGIKCIDIEQLKMFENFENENLLVLSSSGETNRTVDLVNNLQGKNRIFAITAKDSRIDQLAELSFTHNILIDKLDPLTREQQIHILVMINDLVSKI